VKKYLKHHELLKQHQKSNKNDKVKAIMGHSLQMNILRTGQNEVGGSMMNQVKQTAVVKAVREKKLVMNTRVKP